MIDRYILINGKPVQEPDLYKWSEWFENTQNRILKKDKKGKTIISTVFLGIDHNFSGTDQPILWETLVFGGKHDGEMDRYASAEEALKGHEKFCKKYLS